MPGEVVSGVVNKREGLHSITSSALTLKLEGREEIIFWKKCVTGGHRYLKKLVRSNIIIDIQFDITKFVDNSVPETPFLHTFGIALPNYLPPSVTLENSKIGSLKAQVSYRLIASLKDCDEAGATSTVDL